MPLPIDIVFYRRRFLPPPLFTDAAVYCRCSLPLLLTTAARDRSLHDRHDRNHHDCHDRNRHDPRNRNRHDPRNRNRYNHYFNHHFNCFSYDNHRS
jgi:hypothetical protein